MKRWICFHNWSRWSDPTTAPGVGVFQIRLCTKCNVADKRWLVTLAK